MFVAESVKGTPVLQLNCSEPQLTLEKTLQTAMETHYPICNIPSHRLLVISDHAPGMVRAVSSCTKRKVWEVQGDVEGVLCCPNGMVYSPDHQALFVADGGNHRVLVVNPADGLVRQVVQLSADMGDIWDMCLYNQQVVVHHGGSHLGVKVSYFSLC